VGRRGECYELGDRDGAVFPASHEILQVVPAADRPLAVADEGHLRRAPVGRVVQDPRLRPPVRIVAPLDGGEDVRGVIGDTAPEILRVAAPVEGQRQVDGPDRQGRVRLQGGLERRRPRTPGVLPGRVLSPAVAVDKQDGDDPALPCRRDGGGRRVAPLVVRQPPLVLAVEPDRKDFLLPSDVRPGDAGCLYGDVQPLVVGPERQPRDVDVRGRLERDLPDGGPGSRADDADRVPSPAVGVGAIRQKAPVVGDHGVHFADVGRVRDPLRCPGAVGFHRVEIASLRRTVPARKDDHPARIVEIVPAVVGLVRTGTRHGGKPGPVAADRPDPGFSRVGGVGKGDEAVGRPPRPCPLPGAGRHLPDVLPVEIHDVDVFPGRVAKG